MLNYLVIRLTARCRTQRGATAVEYGLLVASVLIVAVGSVKFFGTLKDLFIAENSKVSVPGAN